MNHDVAEVNGSDPSMLPGSFLYEKGPGYEATFSHGAEVDVSICTRPLSSFLSAAHEVDRTAGATVLIVPQSGATGGGKELHNFTRHSCRVCVTIDQPRSAFVTSPSFQVVSRPPEVHQQ